MERISLEVIDGKVQVGEWHGSHASKYGFINDSLKEQLSKISMSPVLAPLCDIELLNGEKINTVCLVNAKDAFNILGDLYFSGKVENQIDIKDVKNICTSKNKLAEKFSKQIEKFWETGMGYWLFYFVFNNGDRELAIHGGRTDCFDFGLKRIEDVIGVEPFDREKCSYPIEPSIKPINPRFCFYNLTE